MKTLTITTLLLSIIGLSGCSESEYESTQPPQINYWEVVDSYGNSNLPFASFQENHGIFSSDLYVDPTLDNGYFELWWDVSSYDDYSAGIYINDRPNLLGAYELDVAYCGNNRDCDYTGFAYCHFESHVNNPHISLSDTLSCTTRNQENTAFDITPLLDGHPSNIYMIIEVCDDYSGYCSSESQKVTFE